MDDLDKSFLRHADTNTNMLHETEEEHLLFCHTQSHGIDMADFEHSSDLNSTDVDAGNSEQSDCTRVSMAVTEIDMSWESILVLAPDSESLDTTSTHIIPREAAERHIATQPVYCCCCHMLTRACTCEKDAIRLQKNRVSAQKSRSIKANKLVQLQEELACYKRMCDALRTQNALLKVQNADLAVKLHAKSRS